jgi:uncharacterized protein (TIGR02147 family)
MNIYTYQDYKDFLKDWLNSQKRVRGLRLSLARALGCQSSFISRVLRESHHLTPEHALSCAQFMNLSESETDYFLHLVHHQRAGTKDLRELLLSKIKKMQDVENDISNRYGKYTTSPPEGLSPDYYSSWLYSAIHYATTIPHLQKLHALAEKFSLPEPIVLSTLKYLVQVNLVKRIEDRWVASNKNMHLTKNSALLQAYHSSWRLQAINEFTKQKAQDLNYTAVYTLSKNDYKKIRSMLVNFIDHSRSLVLPSKEEILVCLNCDFFEV